MKYFGEYLVSKGIISEDSLVNALVEQLRGVPSVAEILFQNKTFVPNVFLKAFSIQSEKRVDFKQACVGLAVWNRDVETFVLQEIQKVRTPLGQILVQKGLADLGTITKALDEFLAKVEMPSDAPASSSSTSATSAAGIDSTMFEEFMSNLSDEKLSQVKNQFEGLSLFLGDVALQKQALSSIVTDVHFIRGLMRSIRLEKFEALVLLLEKLCIRMTEKLNSGENVDISSLSARGISAIEMFLSLKQELAKNASEEAWFLDETRRQKFKELFNSLHQQ